MINPPAFTQNYLQALRRSQLEAPPPGLRCLALTENKSPTGHQSLIF